MFDLRSKQKQKEEPIIEYSDKEPQELFGDTDPFNADCILWGKWFPHKDAKGVIYSEFNIGPRDSEERIQKILFGNQFKLVLYDTGELYSWGISSKGTSADF